MVSRGAVAAVEEPVGEVLLRPLLAHRLVTEDSNRRQQGREQEEPGHQDETEPEELCGLHPVGCVVGPLRQEHPQDERPWCQREPGCANSKSRAVAPTGTAFVTSDCALYTMGDPERGDGFWERGVGLASPGAHNYFPLGSRHCLLMTSGKNRLALDLVPKVDARRSTVDGAAERLAGMSDRFFFAADRAQGERLAERLKLTEWRKPN